MILYAVWLQVLSLSNNRLEDVHALTSLRCLHVLRVDHNRIMRLPASLSTLRELNVLDVSHNRLEAMPPALADLAARLYRLFENPHSVQMVERTKTKKK